MRQGQFWKSTVLFCAVPMLLFLMLAGAEAQAPATGKAKVAW